MENTCQQAMFHCLTWFQHDSTSKTLLGLKIQCSISAQVAAGIAKLQRRSGALECEVEAMRRARQGLKGNLGEIYGRTCAEA